MGEAGPIVSIGDGGARGKEAPSMYQNGNACGRTNSPAEATSFGSAAITIMVRQTGGSTFAQPAQGCEALVPEESAQ